MKISSILIGIGSTVLIMSIGLLGIPVIFEGRILPGVAIDDQSLAGMKYTHLSDALTEYDHNFQGREVTIELRERMLKRTLGDLGASIENTATAQRVLNTKWVQVLSGQGRVRPVVAIDHSKLNSTIQKDFISLMTFPRDATLRLAANNQFELIPGKSGEGIDRVALARDLEDSVRSQNYDAVIQLAVINEPPAVSDKDVGDARNYATQLLRDGFTLTYEDKSWIVKPFTLKRLLSFVSKSNQDKSFLGVTFNESELTSYLSRTLVPDINQEARDARFSRVGDHVEQFATPQEGRALNIESSVKAINEAVANTQLASSLVVNTVTPDVKEVEDINALGVGKLLTTGITNFSGSPANRRHNIEVGVSRFHGLLIPPGKEFSFVKNLGPVDGEHGFNKELVIKANVTTPEFGGGLCQVSTTLFHAAVQAGLDVVQRRNHAYAVKYYGKPGFDATIYPPYTDLRFINNTPGYILIQARVEGNTVIFELWGTDDGRQVSITGPTTYDWQPDGAVKATLKQHVVKADGSTLLDQVFYSRYKSPNLFPHATTTDPAPVPATPTTNNVTTEQPKSTPTPSSAANPT